MAQLLKFKTRADAAVSRNRDEALTAIVATLKKVRELAKPGVSEAGHHLESVEYRGFLVIFDSNPHGLCFAIHRSQRHGGKRMTGYLYPQPPRGRLNGMIDIMSWKRDGWEAEFCA
jgi:hypothetical protein